MISKPRRTRSLNHARVDTYKVSMNENFSDHFLINPNYIHEDELMFVYKDGDSEVQKKIPMTALVKHFKVRKFFGRDPQTLNVKYNGYVYEIPADVVLAYKA